jgi:hypothetical protein
MRFLRLICKHGEIYVLARDVEEELRAYLYLFNYMDEMDFYSCGLRGDQHNWYLAAKAGNATLARELLRYRSDCDCEYEKIYVEMAITP